MIYSCCNENRRAAVLGNPAINGIDYLEVVDGPSTPAGSPRQQTLLITCLNAAPATLTPDNVLITGGESVTSIGVEWIAPAIPAPARQARLRQFILRAFLPPRMCWWCG